MAKRRRAEFLRGAREDVQRLTGDDRRLGQVAMNIISELEAGTTTGQPLEVMAATGDLSDCRKVYFAADDGPPTHRLVYRDVVSEPIEVIEIIALEAREELYAYLLAAQRLGRLPAESKSRFGRVHQQAIERRSARKRPPRSP